MINIEEEEQRKTRCFLVGEPGNDLSELKRLVSTLEMDVAFAITLARIEVTPAYGIGTGKAAEIAAMAHEYKADCIIFDFVIEPTKQRNWEKLSSLPVFDRQEVILQIFSQHARTREAVLQVQLAQLNYSLPRLAHTYGNMARQRGGSYGAKGAGETQLELDQRQVHEKIRQVKSELLQVVTNRQTQRKRRRKVPVPLCALVGYTNAGKSSLLNALTDADAFVEDKLFATLDTTTRRLSFKEGGGILLTDTVGFISNLPHGLIEAFKSTLEETALSQLLLVVIDSSDADAENQYDTVMSVLTQIKADKIPRLLVLNKIDKVRQDDALFCQIKSVFPDAVNVSAKTHEGFETLTERISTVLFGEKMDVIIPLSNKSRLDYIRKNGIIYTEEWLDDGIHVKARLKDVPQKDIAYSFAQGGI